MQTKNYSVSNSLRYCSTRNLCNFGQTYRKKIPRIYVIKFVSLKSNKKVFIDSGLRHSLISSRHTAAAPSPSPSPPPPPPFPRGFYPFSGCSGKKRDNLSNKKKMVNAVDVSNIALLNLNYSNIYSHAPCCHRKSMQKQKLILRAAKHVCQKQTGCNYSQRKKATAPLLCWQRKRVIMKQPLATHHSEIHDCDEQISQLHSVLLNPGTRDAV